MTTSTALNEMLLEIRAIHGAGDIPLHRPVFVGNERRYLSECIDSNFVSSVGARVTEFEQRIVEFTGCKYAVATVNGTAALHVSLLLAGVKAKDEVLSQAVTFVATCNALAYIGAAPVFIDVDLDTMSMSPKALSDWLETNAIRRGKEVFNKISSKRISACVPMHTFGNPGRIKQLVAICQAWGISLIEDAAESLGSWVGETHTGNFGLMGTLSFNGNKVITTGGGGMIMTNDSAIALRAKHLTTTAKRPHAYEFFHDEVGYNYRLPNLNAALGCAQMEMLPAMLQVKKQIAKRYELVCKQHGIHFVSAVEGSTSNHWLNAIVLDDLAQRDEFLRRSNEQKIMTRPLWRLMSSLPAFVNCHNDGLSNSRWLEERVINIPSSVPDDTARSLKL